MKLLLLLLLVMAIDTQAQVCNVRISSCPTVNGIAYRHCCTRSERAAKRAFLKAYRLAAKAAEEQRPR